MLKKIFGYFFIVLSVLLSLIALLRILSIVTIFASLLRIFTGNASSYEFGYVFGQVLIWGIYFFLIYILWKYGRRWTKGKATTPTLDNVLDLPVTNSEANNSQEKKSPN